MEDADRAPADAGSSSSSSQSHTASNSNGEHSSAASSSTTDPRVEEEEPEDDEAAHPQLIHQRTSVSYDAHRASTENEENLQLVRDDTWSCIVVILTFWFFVSMTMILGVYGSSNFLLGPNSSILIRPNLIFVEYLKVKELEEASNQPTLYGFYKTPPLDVVTTWSETHKTFLPSGTHKEWVYFLNQGSQMNVSYRVNSSGRSSLIFVIAQGNEGLSQWLEDPSYPNSTLSWNTIHGSGIVQQDMYMSSSYYVAVANLNAEAAEVELNVEIRAFLYNTSGAYYKCSLSRGQCNFELSFNGGNIAVLTSPSPTTGRGGDQWYVKLSYGPRWMTYIAGIGIMTVMMVTVFHLLNNFECRRGNRVQYGDLRSERTPLLSNKDDDLSSWGSSYDSVSQDDEDLEDAQTIGSLEGKSTKDGEYNNTRRLCAICFDAPRDCFFLPCGHCVACFACGTRIAEAAGSCPICRRHMKKVRKIFTV